jgi:hypothetical protein
MSTSSPTLRVVSEYSISTKSEMKLLRSDGKLSHKPTKLVAGQRKNRSQLLLAGDRTARNRRGERKGDALWRI